MTEILTTSDLVDALIDRLVESYVFPDRAAEAARLLRSQRAAGRYPDVGPDLCEQLSDDLLEACGDKHLRLFWHDQPEESGDEAELVAAMLEQFRLENHGFRRVELLADNVGLIELTLVPPVATAAETIAAALALIQHTDALILDLRPTRGGSPDGVAFMCSYLFADGDTHLNDVIEGPNGPLRQYWTFPQVPGPRYLDRPVYVLTSATTFSGGEELAYDLQALDRAVVVGEPTRGGAHPSTVVSLTQQVELRLPIARSVNPHTGTNWEAVGVQPDIATPAADACDVAHKAAVAAVARG